MDSHIKALLKRQLTLNMTISEIGKYFGVSKRIILPLIKSDEELLNLYQTKVRERKTGIKQVACFTKPLTKEGCNNLAQAVIKKAVQEKNIDWFKTDNFDFYQFFVDNGLEAEDYIKLIEHRAMKNRGKNEKSKND